MRQLSLFKAQRLKRRGRPKKKSAGVSHLRRPELARRFPVLLTLRVRAGVPDLQRGRCLRALRRAFFGGNGKFGLRLVHFALLGNHMHFVAEAEGKESLSRGMQGLGIRMAKALNRVAERRGSVFADRYHARILRSPTQVKNAVVYVLRNHEHHFGAHSQSAASSVWFPNEMAAPVTWLLRQAPS